MIGREAEQKVLSEVLKRKKSSFLAVTGRRRVGKTHLIDTYFEKHMCFRMTGAQSVPTEEHLINFSNKLSEYSSSPLFSKPTNWQEAFLLLKEYLKSLDKRSKKVIFIDELPWIVTRKSGMLKYLAHLWNDFLSKEKHFILVVCGSASSWLTKHIINDVGGLHNRVTDLIHLRPFTLKETKLFLESKNIRLTHQEITKLYMTFGGVPFYLEQLRKGENSTTAIERICFSNQGILKNEYRKLYRALFRNATNHEAIVEVLAGHSSGLNRDQIIKQSKVSSGGAYDRTMNDLILSGFVSEIIPFGKKKRGVVYRLEDEFSIFYHRFMKSNKKYSKGIWGQLSASQSYKIWTGYAFESLCHKHIDEIKKALGIAAVFTENYSYRVEGSDDSKGFQIDLILERKDEVIHLFEIKYYGAEFKIDKNYANRLRERKQHFIEHTKTKKQVFTSFITNFGVYDNVYANEIVEGELTVEHLFE